jgi:hypothetical protein
VIATRAVGIQAAAQEFYLSTTGDCPLGETLMASLASWQDWRL